MARTTALQGEVKKLDRGRVTAFIKSPEWEALASQLDRMEGFYMQKLLKTPATKANLEITLGYQFTLNWIEQFKRIPMIWMQGKVLDQAFAKEGDTLYGYLFGDSDLGPAES